MKRRVLRVLGACITGLAALALGSPMLAAPSVYPTGTTIYDPEQAQGGYTVLSILGTPAVIVIDMNGRVVKRWDGFNVSSGGPARVLPGGIAVGPTGTFPRHQESRAMIAQDFGGTQLWQYHQSEAIEIDGEQVMSGRQHHDWQLANFPAGYPSPGISPTLEGTRKLLLTHSSLTDDTIADIVLEDDRLIELSAGNEIIWEWRASQHVDELGFDVAARTAIRRLAQRDAFDWFHVNSATYLGPNRWFDAGDERFNPDNVIISSRQANVIAIIARDGSVVWRIGPDFSDSLAQQAIGQIIGQHHAHLIPIGLPGAGNLLVFDNGGSAGYGDPTAVSPNGNAVMQRPGSRVLEINPVTLEVVWSYANANFYSFNISSAQRLENGNTLITEGAPGRIFEVTSEGDIVWEYMNGPSEGYGGLNSIYRAYRIPYGWIPQLPVPEEVAIARPDPASFHVPGSVQ
ncbi:aryl-sulfate sulfotransferase [Alteraurantiacibacter aestuarii]|uniref:Thioredoxin n=1 Tax=Alteraurantiacibacter aestuarii TaxID=650004 RepID=A0A844ZLZ8_9SPHN|nr:aryl-sulfate sulfotransferase [Alteraurantiacibacter aestuarii]MXO88613.1 thioredoxin [Alteraurantiacibacter aestuarii]